MEAGRRLEDPRGPRRFSILWWGPSQSAPALDRPEPTTPCARSRRLTTLNSLSNKAGAKQIKVNGWIISRTRRTQQGFSLPQLTKRCCSCRWSHFSLWDALPIQISRNKYSLHSSVMNIHLTRRVVPHMACRLGVGAREE